MKKKTENKWCECEHSPSPGAKHRHASFSGPTKTQHTPTPWKKESGYNKAGFPFFEIRDAEGFQVMSIRGGSLPTSQDAEFIVRAVNLHEALLASLKKSHVHHHDRGTCQMCDLIAQAEGGK